MPRKKKTGWECEDVRPLIQRAFLSGVTMTQCAAIFSFDLPKIENIVRQLPMRLAEHQLIVQDNPRSTKQ